MVTLEKAGILQLKKLTKLFWNISILPLVFINAVFSNIGSNGLYHSGNFYVRYKTGERSVGMSYSAAKALANVYSGSVWHVWELE